MEISENHSINVLGLETRTLRCLWNSFLENYDDEPPTIKEVCNKGSLELLRIKNFGPNCLIDLEEKLEEVGFHLKDGPRKLRRPRLRNGKELPQKNKILPMIQHVKNKIILIEKILTENT